MVTFTRIPYAEAARRAERQDRIIYIALTIATVTVLVLAITFTALLIHRLRT
jgi:heme/copper-type cytochrome/quinol oxidase subunit 2